MMFKHFFNNLGSNKLVKPMRFIILILALMLMTLIIQSALLYKTIVNERVDSRQVTTVTESTVKMANNQVLGATTDPIDAKEITILGETIGRPFTDVSTNHINFVEIHYLKAKGIVNGGAEFFPNRTLTRVESIAMVTKAAEIENKENMAPIFTDVTAEDWFYNVINTAYDINLIDGFTDGTFRPHEPITQSGFIKLALAALNLDVTPYRAPGQEWHEAYLNFAVANHIITEKQPFIEITRAEGSEILYRLMRNFG